MSKSRTESPEIRKRQILNAARVLMAQKSYDEFRIEDVARKAQLGKGTLYLHFKDKSQIIVALHEDLLDQLDSQLKQLHGVEGVCLLERVAEIALGFLRANHDFFSGFMQNKSVLVGSNRKAVLKRFQKHIVLIDSFLKMASDKDDIPEFEGYLGSLYFISLIRMFWEMGQIPGITRDKKNDPKVLMGLFLNGIHANLNKGKKS